MIPLFCDLFLDTTTAKRMSETLLPKSSHEFSSHSRNGAKEEEDGCVSDPRQLNQQIKDHMGNQFPFTTGSFKQAVNLAGTVLAMWCLSLGIVHCSDLFGMIYSFNVLRGKKVWVKFRCKFVVLLSEAFKKAKQCIFLKSRAKINIIK